MPKFVGTYTSSDNTDVVRIDVAKVTERFVLSALFHANYDFDLDIDDIKITNSSISITCARTGDKLYMERDD